MYPQRDLPRAVIGTLVIVGELRILCAVALTGMQPYTQLDGFAGAFRANGWEWAAQEVTAVGEVLTLPVVVLVCLLAQPRLLLAMADDGLLPDVFGRVDPLTGNL
jgi:APA family basic amino acid/polyamine antiporter